MTRRKKGKRRVPTPKMVTNVAIYGSRATTWQSEQYSQPLIEELLIARTRLEAQTVPEKDRYIFMTLLTFYFYRVVGALHDRR